VLRNRPAREVLERLAGKPLMIPIEIRRTTGLHPETLRRLLTNLDDFDLVSMRPLPLGSRGPSRTVRPLRVDLSVTLTKEGENVLRISREVRRAVVRRAALLPKSSTENWLTGMSAQETCETGSSA